MRGDELGQTSGRPSRQVATVNGKIIGMPALVDNLAIVYNKKLFASSGSTPPTPTWTWDDFRAAAKG